MSPKLVPPGSQRNKADAPSLRVMADDGWSHNYCSYYPNASASPAGPASGQSWAVGKAYRSFGWEIATSGRDGFDAESTTQSATSTSSLPIYLSPSWPSPARIEGWAEPQLSGTFALNAGVSGFGVASGSNGRFTQDIGWTVGAQSFMTRFFDISESTAGVEKVRRYAFDTAAGMAYPFDIQVQPGTTHNFTGTSTVTSVATATYGAGAYSQVDFGSANIDAPSSDPNGHVYMDRKGYVVIDYKLPSGWTTGC
ncbi:hypothetical protein EU811_21540 [Arthrobacter sp. TS-15]|uniref:hypothetical protein n=1 Tax=Arthrobacter sp. TS-15 TaxID=2510797 RepID=UPI00115DD9B5|nr:hypothetical protein [Arthrobacter sp. TS-15]TQS88028.1 hypothetical protein EU811_21540 [Arthrobacter sp. TS-15]